MLSRNDKDSPQYLEKRIKMRVQDAMLPASSPEKRSCERGRNVLTIIPINPIKSNSYLGQTSHCNIKGLSVSEVMIIENMITQVQFY